MSVLIEGIDGIVTTDSSELAVFTSDTIYAGAVRLKGAGPWGLAAWGDDDATPAIDGFLEGDSLHFVFWDPVRGVEFPARGNPSQGSLKYSTNALLILRILVIAPPLPPTAPEWEQIPDQKRGYEGSLIEFELRGRDLNGDPLTITYSSPDLPPTAIFDDFGNGSGRFDWQTTYFDAGDYTAVFDLSDGTFHQVGEVAILVLDSTSSTDSYFLEGPFPNPIIGGALLKLSLPDDSSVSIEAFDLTGRSVGVLSQGWFPQGIHWVTLNTKSLVPGVHFFKMRTHSVEKTATGIVLR